MPHILAGAASSLKADQPPTNKAQPITSGSWTGKIGNIELSRLMLGGNVITACAHSRDLRYVGPLMQHYNTPEKVLETLDLAVTNGVNSINTHISDRRNDIVKEYRKKHNNALKWILAVYAVPMSDTPFEFIDRAKQEGADAIYLWGVAADGLVPKKHGPLETDGRSHEGDGPSRSASPRIP